MKNYNNLEIFIQTYNRAEFLAQTLKSICNQSAQDFDIIIADNASTDSTKEIVEDLKQQFPDRNIVFLPSEKNIGGPENTKRIISMAKKEWTMIFHDDDLIHPNYIKTAMDLANQNPDVVTVSCTYIPYENPKGEDWEVLSSKAYMGDEKEFASLLFRGLTHNFASTIYKTAILKQHEVNMELYGKISDRPFMLDIAKHGKNIVLKDPYIRYRLHAGQDSNTASTGPFENEYFALMNNYKSIMGNSWISKYGFIYNSFVHSQLRTGFYWISRSRDKKRFGEFKNLAAESKVIRKFERHRLIEKLYAVPRFFCKSAFNIYDKILMGR